MRILAIAIGLLAAALLICLASRSSDLEQSTNALSADPAAKEVVLIDASAPLDTNPPAPGWFHHTFVLRAPMRVSKADKDGVAALRCETSASGSIFGRYVDIDIQKFRNLRWRWQVEKPIESEIDERAIAGDDHAARLFLRFVDSEGGAHMMEIIWSNRHFRPGDYKFILGFPHYVAHSGRSDVGKWISEEVDLVELYQHISGRSDSARLRIMALFCDSDDTLTSSIAYFGQIKVLESGSE